MSTMTTAGIRAKFQPEHYFGQAFSLFVTASDIDHIKAAARTILPGMQPQRRLEAVARALRFKSFAAMSAALSRATHYNPLLLQVAFGPRSDIIKSAFEEHLSSTKLVPADIGVPHSIYGYVATGSVFLSALFASRDGSLKAWGEEAIFRMGFETEINGHHRAAALQNLPDFVVEHLREQGAVLILENGVEIAPAVRIISCLKDDDVDLLVDELGDALDYDLTYVEYSGEGAAFGNIALNNAVFISDNETHIDVLPNGWSSPWMYSIGAVFSDWDELGAAEQLRSLREDLAPLVKELGIPACQIGRAFRLVPELANEKEAIASPQVDAHHDFKVIQVSTWDGKMIRD